MTTTSIVVKQNTEHHDCTYTQYPTSTTYQLISYSCDNINDLRKKAAIRGDPSSNRPQPWLLPNPKSESTI